MKIKDLPKIERPREKLEKYGPEYSQAKKLKDEANSNLQKAKAKVEQII